MRRNHLTDLAHTEKISFIKKNDFILLAALVCLAGILLLFTQGPGRIGGTVIATIDGEVYGSWSLSDDLDLDIVSSYGSNRLQIKNGVASVLSADCPDFICVHHVPISRAGERIVCLPNHLVVSIDTATGPEAPDAVSQ